MPFKSENQRRFLWANHPDIARKWTREHGSKVATSTPASSGGVKPGNAIGNIRRRANARPANAIGNIRKSMSPASSQIRRNAFNKLKANGVVS